MELLQSNPAAWISMWYGIKLCMLHLLLFLQADEHMSSMLKRMEWIRNEVDKLIPRWRFRFLLTRWHLLYWWTDFGWKVCLCDTVTTNRFELLTLFQLWSFDEKVVTPTFHVTSNIFCRKKHANTKMLYFWSRATSNLTFGMTWWWLIALWNPPWRKLVCRRVSSNIWKCECRGNYIIETQLPEQLTILNLVSFMEFCASAAWSIKSVTFVLLVTSVLRDDTVFVASVWRNIQVLRNMHKLSRSDVNQMILYYFKWF